ncbi:MAG: alpha/beta hydrolase [Mobilicoccus sp.]|nr:alpha/beta hydrolase [Mobilicoccus sp.]
MTPKPLLVVVHGLLSTPRDFGDQVSALPADRLEAMAPWLRGTRPGAKDDAFDLVNAAADLAMTIELSGAPKTTLFGVDEGALVALEIALSRPDLDVDLVLCGPALAASAAAGMQRRLSRFIPRGVFARRGIDKQRALAGLDALVEADLWGRLPSLTARTLLIVGEKDRAGLTAAQGFADDVPADTRIEVIEGAGRAPHLQNAAGVNAVLYDFVALSS